MTKNTLTNKAHTVKAARPKKMGLVISDDPEALPEDLLDLLSARRRVMLVIVKLCVGLFVHNVLLCGLCWIISFFEKSVE
jgi:hypothetical protein